MTQRKPKRKRVIKAYAIILHELDEIQTAAYFSGDGCGCGCSEVPNGLAIYKKKKDAVWDRKNCLNPKAQKLIPIKIVLPQ